VLLKHDQYKDGRRQEGEKKKQKEQQDESQRVLEMIERSRKREIEIDGER
jgi:hypothetical protein